MFDEFVTPYLKQLITGYREMGFYVIKHTDGNIMPILDLVACDPCSGEHGYGQGSVVNCYPADGKAVPRIDRKLSYPRDG